MEGMVVPSSLKVPSSASLERLGRSPFSMYSRHNRGSTPSKPSTTTFRGGSTTGTRVTCR